MQATKSYMKYEIFGKVQRVFFRKHTKEIADSLELKGWVENTVQKTVIGEALGTPENIKKLEKWLREVGSPKSRIDKAEIIIVDNYKEDFKYKIFTIIK